MAKVQIKNEKITPFGGIYFVTKQFKPIERAIDEYPPPISTCLPSTDNRPLFAGKHNLPPNHTLGERGRSP